KTAAGFPSPAIRQGPTAPRCRAVVAPREEDRESCNRRARFEGDTAREPIGGGFSNERVRSLDRAELAASKQADSSRASIETSRTVFASRTRAARRRDWCAKDSSYPQGSRAIRRPIYQ